MTLITTAVEVAYNGPGAGPFAFAFKIFDATDLVVTVTNPNGVVTTLNYNSDYTVIGANEPNGGSVTLTTPLVAGAVVTIVRNPPVIQDTDLKNQGAFYAATVEAALDYLTMLIQYIGLTATRAIRIPATIAGAIRADITSFLPNYYLRITSDGLGVEGVTNVIADPGFIQSGTGAVLRTANSKMADHVHVRDFGVFGDGIHDDAPAFNRAATAHPGAIIDCDGGSWLLATSVALPTGTTLDAHGSTLTLATGAAMGITASGTDVTVQNCNIVGNGSIGIYMGHARCTVRNCRITGCVQAEATSGACAAILTTGADDFLAENNYCYGNGYVNGGASSIFDIGMNVQGVPSVRGKIIGNKCISTLAVANIACFLCSDTIVTKNTAAGAVCFSTTAGGYGILMYKIVGGSCTNNSVVDNLVYNTQGSGIYMQAQFRCTVANNRVHDVASVQDDSSLHVAGISMAGCPFSVCADNRIENSGKAGISAGDSPSAGGTSNEGSTIVGNTVLAAIGRAGIYLRSNLLGNSICGNTIEGCDGGIASLLNTVTTVDCTIAGNVIRGGVGNTSAIELHAATHCTISGNTITGAPAYGIYVADLSSTCLISDNVVMDCSQTISGSAYGIHVGAPDTTVVSNTVGNTGATGVDYCIFITTGATECVVVGNRCKNGVTGDIHIIPSGCVVGGNADRNANGIFKTLLASGWTVQTTTPARGDMGATPSTATVAATLAALIDDLRTAGYLNT